MLSVSHFLRLIRYALEISAANGEPVAGEALDGTIRILSVCEKHSAEMEERLMPTAPRLLPANVVSLQAWLEAKLTNPNNQL